jgi:LuxR family maltose regulon positive regulatory protein
VDWKRRSPEFLNGLLSTWAAAGNPIVIVLDDVHRLRDPQLNEELGILIEHLPARSRMLLTTRADPHLPVSRWRSRGWLAELRQRDLALTLPETIELFDALGEHRLSPDELERLWRHTEGWVAGLLLAAAGLKDRADVSAAVDEFSGRTPVVADLLADELLHRAPHELSEFLLRTSVADVLDAQLCDALSGRNDSADVLRRLEADLKFVMATGPSRDAYRYHPLLREMLRSHLKANRPDEVQSLNRLAAAVLERRGDIVAAVRCRLAAGDTDSAFAVVFEAAYRRADLADSAGVMAFVSLFPRELVTESASRMLTYALTLGLAGHLADAHAWLQRAQLRIGDQSEARAKDVATLDALRLLTFTVSAGAGDEIAAGRRAVEAVGAGLDLGVAGSRVRMNLVRGYLLIDEPAQAQDVLRTGNPGDEIATLLLAPALAARIALRQGRITEAERQAAACLRAAHAFGLDNHIGTVDAHLALAAALVDRNELGRANTTFQRLEEILKANGFARVYQVLLRLEKVRVHGALHDFDAVFDALREARKLVEDTPQAALQHSIDAAAARWHLEVGESAQARELIGTLPSGGAAHTILRARLDLATGRLHAVKDRFAVAPPTTMRDQLTADLLMARAAVASGEDPAGMVRAAVELAAPEGNVRAFLDEGAAVTRIARAAAHALGTEAGTMLSVALGSPAPSRGPRRPTAVLTDRELTILRYLPTRLTNDEIARECLLSVNTVKAHLKSIYAKLGTSSRAQSIDRARLLGLL